MPKLKPEWYKDAPFEEGKRLCQFQTDQTGRRILVHDEERDLFLEVRDHTMVEHILNTYKKRGVLQKWFAYCAVIDKQLVLDPRKQPDPGW